MAGEYRGVTGVYISFTIDTNTPIDIVPIGRDYPGRLALRLGNIGPDVSVSVDNAALARLRDAITTHLDSDGPAS
jgi:hypothetical protein